MVRIVVGSFWGWAPRRYQCIQTLTSSFVAPSTPERTTHKTIDQQQPVNRRSITQQTIHQRPTSPDDLRRNHQHPIAKRGEIHSDQFVSDRRLLFLLLP